MKLSFGLVFFSQSFSCVTCLAFFLKRVQGHVRKICVILFFLFCSLLLPSLITSSSFLAFLCIFFPRHSERLLILIFLRCWRSLILSLYYSKKEEIRTKKTGRLLFDRKNNILLYREKSNNMIVFSLSILVRIFSSSVKSMIKRETECSDFRQDQDQKENDADSIEKKRKLAVLQVWVYFIRLLETQKKWHKTSLCNFLVNSTERHTLSDESRTLIFVFQWLP